jgi:hypothetical protein
MTLADYFEKAVRSTSSMQSNRRRGPDKPSGKNRFHDILNTMTTASGVSDHKPRGLTLTDYRSSPIMVRADAKTRDKTLLPGVSENRKSDVKEGGATVSLGPASLDPVSGNAVEKADHTVDNNRVAGHADEKKIFHGRTSERHFIDGCIRSAAIKHDLPERLVHLVVEAESGYRPQVVSRAGAKGLMQLMPETAKDLGVSDPFNIEQNIEGGVRYLKKMMDRFKGDVGLALAAYNAGPGNVSRYQGIPPFKETREYVQKIMGKLG